MNDALSKRKQLEKQVLDLLTDPKERAELARRFALLDEVSPVYEERSWEPPERSNEAKH